MSMNGAPVETYPPALVEAAQLLQNSAQSERQAQWPYPWIFPPPSSEERCPNSVVSAPTNGVLTQLLAFPVPDGFYFRISGILLTYIGVPVDDSTQLVTWNLDVDIPLTTLTTPAIPGGYRLPDYGVVTTHLGSLDFSPWPVDGPLIIPPRSTLRVKVKTTAPFTVGPPVSFVTRIRGYIWSNKGTLASGRGL